ncbi:hypothetical protein LTR47_011255 [Exophiala xenobiotica]|nr:hypothetical protein LTR92_010756 [Exophiala xenobiotica]KAK5202975.1 hypothetical protein LTR41_011293 [Exophiala xenobiotica]KAK5215238.1 hypothetical protein LTR72_011691 [Exophiala xenobiotica]KAK5220312.1 hypothetical protein LTR47_011255 [Exophiala xenobiotica]KAK5247787.1 hypothetical protein LTS06_007090 [Exophiala xenobiotica]
MTIRAWRHIVKAIIREYSQDRKIREIMHEYHDMEVSRDDFHDRHFGHSGHIAGILYGRDLMENPMHTVSDRESFRRVSVEWHRFLQFPSSPRSSSSKQLQRVDLRGSLRQLVQTEHAEFRGQPEEALQAIVHRVSPIVVVMGTSAGKSALFMLPASMSHRHDGGGGAGHFAATGFGRPLSACGYSLCRVGRRPAGRRGANRVGDARKHDDIGVPDIEYVLPHDQYRPRAGPYDPWRHDPQEHSIPGAAVQRQRNRRGAATFGGAVTATVSVAGPDHRVLSDGGTDRVVRDVVGMCGVPP